MLTTVSTSRAHATNAVYAVITTLHAVFLDLFPRAVNLQIAIKIIRPPG